MPDAGTPLDKILAILEQILARLDKLEGIGPKPVPEPQKTGGLYDFVRPVPVEPRHGAGVKMTSPDANEAILRSKYSVRWNGDVMLQGAAEDTVWLEIERLKAGDAKLIQKYSMLDPTFAGFALLTSLLDPVEFDGFIGQSKRDGWAGWTVEQFIAQQFGIDARPSGDE
jgi:hypothetical protein